jgi:CheY-like chemotaxis protein
VLVVEDDATNQRLIQAMLEKLGVLPVIVADGRAAVDTLGGGFLPDLVLMDCQMPVMDGYEATRLWRQQEPASGQRLPIIALTANVFEENRLRCRAAGMDDFLAKPIHLQALAGMLNKWLRGADGSGWAAGYPATGGEAVLFDGADFAERFGGDRELMACVIDIYLAEWPQSLSELEAALDAGDLAAAHRLAHALKGACGNVSGLALAALAARVESAAAAGDMTAARAAFGESAVAAQSLDQSLRTLRAEWQVAAT